jgi:hypothetical protein
MPWEAIQNEVSSVWGGSNLNKLLPIFTKWGLLKDGYWKTSVLTRPYILRCIEDVVNGVELDAAYARHHGDWAKVATEIRA